MSPEVRARSVAQARFLRWPWLLVGLWALVGGLVARDDSVAFLGGVALWAAGWFSGHAAAESAAVNEANGKEGAQS